MKLGRWMRKVSQAVVFPVALLLLLLLAARARGAAYYSTGAPITTSMTANCGLTSCSPGVALNVSTPIGTVPISAAVYLPTSGNVSMRFQLNGTALAGYRGGVLLSPGGALLSAGAVGGVTIRTYLKSAPTVVQDERLVDASALKAQLLSGKGAPVQLELISTKPFDQVEVEFNSTVSLGSTVYVHYAYGVGPNTAAQVTGLTSNTSNAAVTGPYNVTGCTNKVNNPGQAADNDPTNYATFSSLLSVSCPAQLQVGLNGTAPAGYQAGFVVGQANNLLDASVLSHLTLKTYKNGVLQETATGPSLLGLSVLPDNKSLLNFKSTLPFDAVAIERNDGVALLDDLRLYYGVGVASLSPQQTISSFTNPSGHYQTSSNGVACVGCTVSTPESAAGNPNSYATITTGIGVDNWSSLRLDLNGPGNAGNRAGMVLGNNTLLDAAALSRVTLITYDDNGNVLETASGSSLLSLNVLPDGRQSVSFNTTKNFSKVGIQIGGLANAVSNTSVYYAFSDSSNGSLSIVAPAGPLPVSLTSFSVRRLAGPGTAEITWNTASELNSASFVVERSAAPAAGFVAIGQVAAAGNSATPRHYTLHDEAATQGATLYYRLRQLDADGRAALSPVVVLAAGATPAGFTLYPNPAPATAQAVTIASSTALAAGTSVSVYSSVGRLLSSQVLSSESTAAALAVPTGSLAPGIYQVVVRDAAGQRLAAQRLLVAGQ